MRPDPNTKRPRRSNGSYTDGFEETPNVLCVTTVVYPDTTSVDRARGEVGTHLIKPCVDHPSNSIEPCMHECNLLPLPDLVDFVDSCYQEFFDGS